MSLILIEPNRLGHLTVSFVNERLRRRIVQRVVENGGPKHQTVYIQHDVAVQELIDSLTARARRDLSEGWGVKVRMDAWEAAHFYGYDAHTVFEGRN